MAFSGKVQAVISGNSTNGAGLLAASNSFNISDWSTQYSDGGARIRL